MPRRFSLDNAAELKVPTLIMHGSDDHDNITGGSREFAEKSGKVVLKIWEGGYHELHNEPFKDEVFRYILLITGLDGRIILRKSSIIQTSVMNLRTNILEHRPIVLLRIKYDDKVMFIGSCFASSIGEQMEKGKMDVMINPAGTVYNPVSVCNTLDINNSR